MDIKEEFLTMTLKGITRTCYGSMFNDDEEVRKMSNIYQKVYTGVIGDFNFSIILSLSVYFICQC